MSSTHEERVPDIGTTEGFSRAQTEDLFTTRCPEYVQEAVDILEDML